MRLIGLFFVILLSTACRESTPLERLPDELSGDYRVTNMTRADCGTEWMRIEATGSRLRFGCGKKTEVDCKLTNVQRLGLDFNVDCSEVGVSKTGPRRFTIRHVNKNRIAIPNDPRGKMNRTFIREGGGS